jgi:hypothetical protein
MVSSSARTLSPQTALKCADNAKHNMSCQCQTMKLTVNGRLFVVLRIVIESLTLLCCVSCCVSCCSELESQSQKPGAMLPPGCSISDPHYSIRCGQWALGRAGMLSAGAGRCQAVVLQQLGVIGWGV